MPIAVKVPRPCRCSHCWVLTAISRRLPQKALTPPRHQLMRLLSAAVLLVLATACQRQTAPAPSPEAAAAKADAASQAPSSQPDATASRKSEPGTVPVNVDNFVRAESDLYIAGV